MSADRVLYVTADDFGYCPQRNHGIIDCFKENGITDTSLLVNTSYAKHAVDLGLHHGLPMGLHFNVSEGHPLSEAKDIESLLDKDGCFLDKDQMLLAGEERRLCVNQIKTELKAQLEKFKVLTGSYPKRVDGHQHVHVFPTIREAFAQVLNEYNIALTRIPLDKSLPQADWMVPELKQFLEEVNECAKQTRELFTAHGIKSSDAFLGCSLMNFESTANLTLQNLRSVMASVPTGTISLELMVHPGYASTTEDGGCGQGPDDFAKDISRNWELNFLTSKELQEYWNAEGWNKASWDKL